MKLNIATRVSLAIGILLFLLFVTSAVSFILTGRIEDDVTRLAEVDVPRQDAVRRMEASLAEMARSVFAYASDPVVADREQSLSLAAEFDRSAETFVGLATNDEERGLGEQIADLFEESKRLGAEIIVVTDQGRAALARGDDEVTRLENRKRELLARFEAQRARIEEVLTAKVLPLIGAGKTRAQSNLGLSTETAIIFLLVISGIGVLVGAGTAVLLTRRIVRPILELTAGVEAIGRGTLDHRIPVRSEDELGKLAASFNRMADARQSSEEALRDLSHHDSLTRLPNRILFQIRLVEALDGARRVNRMVAVHILDLDHFKDINDTLGHPAGDQLLQQVAERLKVCIRRSDTVARIGGDEFAIIQTNLLYNNGIAVLAKRLIDTLAKPFSVETKRVFTGTSVGITIFPHDDTEANKLVKNADLALYRAKQEGRNKYQLYDPEMNAEVQARKALEHDIRDALDNGEFFLNYQPQLDLASDSISGAEALVRWQHPERGLVSPVEFIPVAEQSGLITHLTEGVVLEACTQVKAWQDAGLPRVRISVNLSPVDFKRKDLIPTLKEILEESGLEPEWLELEITEGMVMSGVESVTATLHELHAIGVELAIDDFGTGFSSMSYLKQFPVDRLKIDQTFVRDILSNKEDASITDAIIKLGHSLDLKVVAEGVETEEQLEFLRASECDEIQGYCFSRPLGADDFAEFIASHMVVEAPRASEMA